MKKILFILLMPVFTAATLLSQSVTTDPAVVTPGKVIKIYFDSSKDNNTGGLKNYTGDLYAHTGVTIDGKGNWQNVIGTWNNNPSQPKLAYLGNFIYRLDITPDIKTFYSLSVNDVVTKICLVLRSSDSKKQTKPDIFIDVFQLGLNAVFSLPEKNSFVTELNREIPVKVSATLADSLTLFINNTYRKSGSTPDLLTDTIEIDQYGEYWVKAVAWDLPETAADSFFFYVRKPVVTEALPSGVSDGINYTGATSATLVLHAPYKDFAFTVGDFNGWRPCDDGYMKKTPDGERYWIELIGLAPGKEYRFQYQVDTSLFIPDPYADKLLDPFNDPFITSETYPGLISFPDDTATVIVSVLQTAQVPYNWQNQTYQEPQKNKLVIYELLVRDFIAKHDFKTITDTLNYLQKLGVNAIELMPVSEFEGNLSWGYNPSFYFAPDKYYGPKNAFRALVDSCHSRGIAVILDIVLNHCFGQSPFVQLYLDHYTSDEIVMKLPNPWFNAVSPNNAYKWGADFNHESPATQALVDRVTSYWLTEYKIDGFRFDFSKGFTNTPGDGGSYDASRINILKRMADKIWQVNPDAYVILEHFAPNDEEKMLAEYGLMLWGNMNYQYSEAVMGYPSNLTYATSLSRGWSVPNLVTYMESHDEERLMYKAITYGASGTYYNIKNTGTALRRIELAAVFFLTLPGPKMIWQFGELGYDVSIDFNGRTGEKPIMWNYAEDIARNRLFTVFRILNDLRKTQDVFSTDDYTYSLSEKQKSIQLNSDELKVNIIGNFDILAAPIFPSFQQTGKWYEYFTDDSLNVVSVNDPVNLQAGEYRLYTSKRLSSPRIMLGIEEKEFIAGNNHVRVYPNPSHGDFNIEIISDHPSPVKISIYDLTGKVIRQLTDNNYVEGFSTTRWDGRTSGGSEAGVGIYFIEIHTGSDKEVLKVIKK